jgi:hypothetical protein
MEGKVSVSMEVLVVSKMIPVTIVDRTITLKATTFRVCMICFRQATGSIFHGQGI